MNYKKVDVKLTRPKSIFNVSKTDFIAIINGAKTVKEMPYQQFFNNFDFQNKPINLLY